MVWFLSTGERASFIFKRLTGFLLNLSAMNGQNQPS